MAEAFSTNDIYYIKANDADTATDDEITYKTNVDKLRALKSTVGFAQKQNVDFNISQNALILNNVTLGIGILAMMWMVYR